MKSGSNWMTFDTYGLYNAKLKPARPAPGGQCNDDMGSKKWSIKGNKKSGGPNKYKK